MVRTKRDQIAPTANDLFEEAGARLHGWGERDYEKNNQGDYTFLEVRRAFELWKYASNPL